ncbi:MAG: LamG domain-containing protein [Bacteroidetes bacterium]|nr:MAG: LamG domain-containing protein [Bacteroidota bacterium]
MKKIFLIMFSVLLLLITSCQDSEVSIVTPPSLPGSTVSFFLNNIPQEVDSIIARMNREGFEERILSLQLSDTSFEANGTMNNVPVGMWQLEVLAYDSSSNLLYSGESMVDVVGGQTNVVELELEPASGNVTIHVTWGKPCVSVPAGIVSWWRGDGNYLDVMGGNHGSISNNPLEPFTKGYVGKAFSFNSSGNNRVFISDAENLKITGSLTIEAWIYPTSYPPVTGEQIILFRGDTRGNLDPYYLGIYKTDSLLFNIESLTDAAILKVRIPLDRWIHVAGTLDSTTGEMKLFVNGNLRGSMFTTVRPLRELNSSYSPGLAIGNTQSTLYNYPFHGKIDEVSIYNRNLSSEEIFSIYYAGRSGKCKTQ